MTLPPLPTGNTALKPADLKPILDAIDAQLAQLDLVRQDIVAIRRTLRTLSEQTRRVRR